MRHETRNLRRPLGLALVLLSLAVSIPARGQEKDPATVFQAASSAFRKKDYAAAARLFEEANSLAPHPSAVVNAAAAWEAAGAKGMARFRFEQALASGGLGDARKREVERKLAVLATQTGTVRIEGSPRVRVAVAGYEGIAAPARIYLEPGTHEATLTSQVGEPSARKLEVRAERETVLVLPEPSSEPPQTQAPAPPPPAPVPSPPPSPPTTHEPRPADTDGSSQRWLGFGLIGAGAVAGGAAAILGVVAIDAKDEYRSGGQTDRDLYDRAVTFRTLTNVAWGAAIVCAATGAVLWLTAPRNRSTVSAVSLFQPRWQF